ncbi:MAG: GntR family transcriptional regulator [Actinomycetia bacterium]|nr:GntR family transcriptional regulator [Actinomycetes bacterium]MCP4086432.1 GntR family transcriptional regulator [Actinomycetes bacterium]
MAEPREATEISDSERVFRHLRRDIIEGRLAPGERIVETRVADALAVSRTPVREAVRRLETEGLVGTEHNRGAHVRSFSEADIADLYEARARLEAFVAELAARRAGPDDVVAVRAAADRFDQVIAEVDAAAIEGLREIMGANDQFHTALLWAGRADQVRRLLAGAIDLPLVFTAFDTYSPHELQRSSRFHQLITDGVAASEPERAGRLMTEHVLQGRDALMTRFRHSREQSEHG